jgi:hypothetical protein
VGGNEKKPEEKKGTFFVVSPDGFFWGEKIRPF